MDLQNIALEEEEETTNESDQYERIPKSRLKEALTVFNYANIIVGAGIMTLPAAMYQGGVGASVTFIILTSLMCTFTSCLLMRCASILSLNTYQEIAQHLFGTPGRVIVVICQFFYPLLASLMFSIIVTDNIIEITGHYLPGTIFATSRPLVLFIFMTLFFAPLSFLHNISYIDKFSFLSIILVCEILLFVVIRFFTIGHKTFLQENAYEFGRTGFLQSMATMCFAFTSHHNTIQVYTKSKNKNLRYLFYIVSYAHLLDTVIIIVITLFCYATFNVMLRGNLFNFYCRGDYFADASRILFVITIALTFPFQILAEREVIKGLFKPAFANHWWLHYVVTFLLLSISYLVPVFFQDVSFIMEVGGGLTAAPIAYMLPVLFYMKAFHKTWKPNTLEMFILWAILIYGGFVTIFSTFWSIYQIFGGRNIDFYRTWCDTYYY